MIGERSSLDTVPEIFGFRENLFLVNILPYPLTAEEFGYIVCSMTVHIRKSVDNTYEYGENYFPHNECIYGSNFRELAAFINHMQDKDNISKY